MKSGLFISKSCLLASSLLQDFFPGHEEKLKSLIVGPNLGLKLGPLLLSLGDPWVRAKSFGIFTPTFPLSPFSFSWLVIFKSRGISVKKRVSLKAWSLKDMIISSVMSVRAIHDGFVAEKRGSLRQEGFSGWSMDCWVCISGGWVGWRWLGF